MRQLMQPVGPRVIAMFLALCCVQVVFAAYKLQVYTVNYPLAYFAERIAGDLAEVTFPAPRGVDPAFWMPDAETIAVYQKADLILLNGADYAKWMLWEGEADERTVERLRAIGIERVVLDPCANRPEKGDFLSEMTENASNLDRIFGQDAGKP